MSLWTRKLEMPTADNALPGRDVPVPVPPVHEVLGQPLSPPFPDDSATIVVGMGCFWGAERVFWETTGVLTTAVGYGGGFTRNPTYEEVCSGLTGHNEVVLAVYDPNVVTYSEMLKLFWENHDPTQGMRQGNDLGTQYRSGIYVSTELERTLAETSRQEFQSALSAAGFGAITTEILDAGEFYYAEHYHQQYLHKVPNGYCGLGSTGVACPSGIAFTE
ncbi:MAG: peptide-methionine (S)-S-oxide reductase MsrA [Actinomycetota bacterium]|nr:peptide-methionine (S)-S-oxide reductase MsrA [Acidimicrobiales bacterium]MEC8827355.1 peptide-methionine (S)-S-oxide reductase MsrA [Actinomycetota bacterium]MEC9270581.1 peptide-methionine (S)-S-oxide reductase MsrA [Actinomycetota bacterium]MEC9316116.1 peptide-methionine (S)-S-oxide reductase MsrA [Actinomycetota bacterium]MED6303943.1 peptide-methionine (S)-S-oxide reductase MsrA [Actinomycetota bacterium]